MASTVTARFEDIQEVRRDLESVRIGLGREITEILREEANPLAARAAALTPRGPGPRGDKDALPHIADTITGAATATGMAIVSMHPAAPIFEFAGHEGTGATIAPRGVPIVIWPARRMAGRAGDEQLPQVERRVDERIGALLHRHGF